MRPVVTVGGLIFDEAGNLLLLRTHKWSNLYGIPGGKVEYGETLETAFAREAREETGLELEEIAFAMNQDCIEHPEFFRREHFVLINYTAKTRGVRPEVRLNDEAEEYLWMPPREALRLSLNQPTRVLLEKTLAGGGV